MRHIKPGAQNQHAAATLDKPADHILRRGAHLKIHGRERIPTDEQLWVFQQEPSINQTDPHCRFQLIQRAVFIRQPDLRTNPIQEIRAEPAAAPVRDKSNSR